MAKSLQRRARLTPPPREAAYQALRAGIIDGRYPAGSPLREITLAAEIGVSRTPIREALRRLDAEGLVDLVPNSGATVCAWTPQDYEEIFTLRALLESHAAERAATRITPSELDALAALCDAMDAAAQDGQPDRADRIAALNDRFHKGLLGAARSRRLGDLLGALVEMPLVLRTYHRYGEEELRRSLAHHREIVAALRTGDGVWASSVMRAHVLAAQAALCRGTRPAD
ncbi:MAG TPA: GntR family transcriptional regulator [Azospirillum sp.]|nr:GntR family transcriptional regulator [Azospirillum sp.]